MLTLALGHELSAANTRTTVPIPRSNNNSALKADPSITKVGKSKRQVEPGRASAVFPSCSTEVELDFAFYSVALHLAPSQVADGPFLAVPPSGAPRVARGIDPAPERGTTGGGARNRNTPAVTTAR